jgi:HSP20 family protein
MKSLIPWKNKHAHAAPSLWTNDWFDRARENPFSLLAMPFTGERVTAMPTVEVTEDKKEVLVRAELPGMDEKDIALTWHNGVLRIRGEKRSEREEKKKGNYYSECSYGMFSRDIPLGNSVDWNAAKAKYKSGVVTVKFPKTESAQKSIEIKVN